MAASTKKVIFVVGPTASGKSAWALEKAIQSKGAIVNCDSVQFYKDLVIGSAAPSENEKKKAPHYLYSYVPAPEEMTAARFIKDFENLLTKEIESPLFVVGGTGFYVQALEKGMYDVEPIPLEFREKIEDELAENGPEGLFKELQAKDPQSKIHINDHYRLVRAIEIIRHTSKIPSQMKKEPTENKKGLTLPWMKVGFSFEKEIFQKKVEERTKNMIKNGLIEETKKILDQGFKSWAPLASVGYKETVELLENNLSTAWLQAEIQQSTMQLIKKQKTWFKRDSSVLWSDQSQATLQTLDVKLDQFLNGH